MNRWQREQQRLLECERRLDNALRRAFPIGTVVRAKIMSGQMNHSVGEVIGHPGGRHAYLRVRLRSRTKQVRYISAQNVIAASR